MSDELAPQVPEKLKGARLARPEPVILPELPAHGATPRSRMKTTNLELPDYVWTELKIRAADRQTSVRHVVMTALVRDGITIAEPDMVEDGQIPDNRSNNMQVKATSAAERHALVARTARQ
ncbi:MAG: hypothetical protein QOF14_4663 [Hyphomicrobiales bacterium]|jgi:hypothetical protein|nr:hypothetical protein [Hyphomicrobiales bacterium]